MRIFVDLDGVLVDLAAGYQRLIGLSPERSVDLDWTRVKASKDFFANLQPMVDMPVLWRFLWPHRPIILTGVPRSMPDEATTNKKAWVRRYLGSEVEVRCCQAKDKHQHAAPGDILIDDWEKYRSSWVEAGGIWITHLSAADTVMALRERGLK